MKDNKDIKKILNEIVEEFEKLVSRKNSWGKNEILNAFKEMLLKYLLKE